MSPPFYPPSMGSLSTIESNLKYFYLFKETIAQPYITNILDIILLKLLKPSGLLLLAVHTFTYIYIFFICYLFDYIKGIAVSVFRFSF